MRAWAPTRADLDAATAATAAAIADPAASLADVERAAGLEEEAFLAYAGRPGAAAEYDLEWADEWDSADSQAYQARVEAGVEPEAGAGL
ncbi:MAG: hypothetical protein ACRDNT_28565 [Streptosporangiaceae bacterium]